MPIETSENANITPNEGLAKTGRRNGIRARIVDETLRRKSGENRAETPSKRENITFGDFVREDLAVTSGAVVDYFQTRMKYGVGYVVGHNGRIDRSVLTPALDELSELTAIRHDSEAEYQAQLGKYQNDLKNHEASAPAIFSRLLNTKSFQDWKLRDDEMKNRGSVLAEIGKNLDAEKEIIAQYVKNLVQAGVSQSTVEKCADYEKVSLGEEITEEEIKNEVIACKQKFDLKISALQSKDDIGEINRIFEERKECNAGLKTIRATEGRYSESEMNELYPEGCEAFDEEIFAEEMQITNSIVTVGQTTEELVSALGADTTENLSAIYEGKGVENDAPTLTVEDPTKDGLSQ